MSTYSLHFAQKTSADISDTDLLMARNAWGEGLIAIAKTFDETGFQAAKTVAGEVIDAVYGFDLGPVLFKPTLSGGAQTFRTDRAGALAYFAGRDPSYPDDVGFGLLGWREVRSETAATFVDGNVAMWMGWVLCTDRTGKVTKVDKTFGYKRDAEGVLRIVLHHSSLPYAP